MRTKDRGKGWINKWRKGMGVRKAEEEEEEEVIMMHA